MGETVRMPRILMVDDDRRMCGFVTKFLAREGFSAEFALDGSSMRDALAVTPFDLIILDLTFPRGEDGLSLARTVRANWHMPLLVLSAKCETVDKIVCLELGADDYVTKPFEPRELLARIRALLRRARGLSRAPAEPPDNRLRFGAWRLDLDRRELIRPDTSRVTLTSHEFRLLLALAERPGRVLSRDQMLDLVANRQWAPFDRSIDVLVGKLRRKLDDGTGHQVIKTVRGEGYVFTPPPAQH
ncbi:response regulator transcription factor [Ancylobacter dichloromethanicus]|uniref:Regulatory protein VirG n=1 Tax=Ancylobacter dichloromethanicus TaxID=518825 RepID=A0A9W6MZV1_9HYPH|nr:response regulator transcription factor [Ancylobacter dichloromethanicus]MBS7555872.1 response regulator transcription factor [Ancylobacter dichloromethanicus]GLK72415.1 DNA-binding response regulator [Ancylobacter dichloromethanicus]